MNREESLRYFFDQISSGINQLKVAPKNLRSKIKQGVRRNIQYWTDSHKPIYSQDALSLCQSKGLDITKIPMYGARKKVGGEKNHPNILPEHTTPINEVIEMLVDSPEDQYFTILLNYSPVCWVTREEDNQLRINKFAKNRPGGWLECYRFCGIVPIM